MADTIYKNDVGVEFIMLLKNGNDEMDPTQATRLRYFFQRKDKTVLEVIPFVITDTDGKKKCNYLSKVGDLNQIGDWKLQAYAESATKKLHTSIYEFTVESNIRDDPQEPDS